MPAHSAPRPQTPRAPRPIRRTLAEDAGSQSPDPDPRAGPGPEQPVPGASEPQTPPPCRATIVRLRLAGFASSADRAPTAARPRRAAPQARHRPPAGSPGTADDTPREAGPGHPGPPGRPDEEHGTNDAVAGGDQWLDRPIERHDSWSDADAAAP